MGLLEAYAGLAGKRAAVLGGSGGVGRAVTLALANCGVDVITCDIDREANATIAAEVDALGKGARIVVTSADVAKPDDLQAFYDRAEQEFESLDISVNVAGGHMLRGPFMEHTREDDARIIRMNYGYVIDSMRRAVPLLRRRGGGSVINFTTIEAQRGAAWYAVYAGAKAATANFSRAVAAELAAENIRVNMIAPDTTPTRGSYSALGPELLAKMGGLDDDIWSTSLGLYVPQNRNPSTEDLANAVLFLVSNLARSILGQTIHVDGGTSATMGFINWPHGDGWGPAPLLESVKRLFSSDQ